MDTAAGTGGNGQRQQQSEATPERQQDRVATLLAEAEEYAGAARAGNTRRAYASDFKQFSSWCQAHGRPYMPASPETIIAYLTDQAGKLKVSTLQRRLAAISEVHKAAGRPTPTADARLRQVWQGIIRTYGRRPDEVAPIGTDTIRELLATLDDDPTGIRDRAIVLLCYAGAFRRSELVLLDVQDVEQVEEGLVITVHRSKTDQQAVGRRIGIPYGEHTDTCPVRAYQAWLESSGITEGPLFRPIDRFGRLKHQRLRAQAVSLVLKRCAERAGLDPNLFSSHSMRSGHVIQAARRGASEEVIMAQTGHRSVVMPRRYIREGSLFRENSAASLGL